MLHFKPTSICWWQKANASMLIGKTPETLR